MKALIVDDEDTSRLLLTAILSPVAEVHTCTDGEEAIEAYRTSVEEGDPFELVCLDVMMPFSDGLEALHQIRIIEADARAAQAFRTRILMTTALKDSGTVTTAFRDQCDGYLVKPIRKDKLLDQLRSLELLP